jgi:murein DD-endopeptidase MepM/ murein hydrolase activator NlpD
MRTALLGVLVLAACGGGEEEIPRGRVQFGFPVAQVELINQFIGVDHDPVVQAGGAASAICTSYDGRLFPWCYDEHHGSDYILDGDFEQMDNGSATVIAAADGVVTEIHDGEYDRCHLDGDMVSCDGFPMVANKVVIEHADGVMASYLHLKNGSLLVTAGQTVTCGTPLALIGSSGNSSFPHLHFEVEVDGVVLDPYAGEHSQPETWWADQGDPEGLPGPGCTAPAP